VRDDPLTHTSRQTLLLTQVLQCHPTTTIMTSSLQTPKLPKQNTCIRTSVREMSNISNILWGLVSMSMFYQVMGAGIRCPKIKKHIGIKLRPLNKARDPFVPNDMLIYTCESEGFTQTIKCLDDGRWSEYPHCPDPSNNTCSELESVPHGIHNSSGPPFKVGTVLAFRCENEALPASMMLPFINQQQQQQMITTTQTVATTTTTVTTKAGINLQNVSQSGGSSAFQLEQNYTNNSDTTLLRYNLTGHRVLRCLPSSNWNHPVPTCTPFYPEPPSNVAFLLTSGALILIPLLILITLFHLVMRWRQRKQQQERWKQYFTDYKYRHSKTNITFGQRPGQPQTVTIPVTDL